MSDPFSLPLCDLQPSQLYISTEKLASVLREFDPNQIEPVPVRRSGGDIVMTDGHTRAFAAHLAGCEAVPVVWDEDELDWEAYEICVQWCKEEGIFWVGDLVGRVLGPADYERLWRGRCREMHGQLASTRGGSDDE
ncbi:MAG: ParB-like nuclease domain-containing protein [Armatimonadetes bacterium]|nr:ParB-like nuclease domain-containing protein [Armatimonadota bacterium]